MSKPIHELQKYIAAEAVKDGNTLADKLFDSNLTIEEKQAIGQLLQTVAKTMRKKWRWQVKRLAVELLVEQSTRMLKVIRKLDQELPDDD